MRRHTIVAAAVVLTLVPAAAACGGSGSASGTTGSATAFSTGGTTTATAGGAGHSFSAQLRSLGALLSTATALSGSHGSAQTAAVIGHIRGGLTTVSSTLASTSVPSIVQTQKQQLAEALDQWNADLGQAQRTAQGGHTAQAIQQVQSSTYRDLKNLVDMIRSVTG
jgi:hypothetical protein